MPPLSEVLDALTRAVLPAVLAAATVFALAAKLLPARLTLAAGALALAAGFLAANHFRAAADFRLDPDRLLTPSQFAAALRATVVLADEDSNPPAARYWLPWTTTLALAVGVVARRIHPAAGWTIRALVVALAAFLAVPTYLRPDAPWVIPALAAIALAEWAVLERLVAIDDASRIDVAPVIAGALTFAAASIILLHAHSARYADVAVILSVTLTAIALVAWFLRADPTGTIPGIAVVLPCLMLNGQQDTFSEVPTTAFALVATAPLALAPLLMPRARKLARPRRLAAGTLLLLLPLATAVALATTNESLSFE